MKQPRICAYACYFETDDNNIQGYFSIVDQVNAITTYVKEHYPCAKFTPEQDIYIDMDTYEGHLDYNNGFQSMITRKHRGYYDIILLPYENGFAIPVKRKDYQIIQLIEADREKNNVILYDKDVHAAIAYELMMAGTV